MSVKHHSKKPQTQNPQNRQKQLDKNYRKKVLVAHICSQISSYEMNKMDKEKSHKKYWWKEQRIENV